MAKTTQIQVILEHLQKWGSITSIEAFQLYGVTRLAAIVFVLRKRGYVIDTTDRVTTNRFGQNTRYAEYRYVGVLAEV